jgi:hypothetical protein
LASFNFSALRRENLARSNSSIICWRRFSMATPRLNR